VQEIDNIFVFFVLFLCYWKSF